MKNFALAFFMIFLPLNFILAQQQGGVSISDDKSAPDPSAMLEVKSNDRGFLPPRMNKTQRDNIANPVAGLMVYNTDRFCMEFYDGTAWNSAVPAGTIKAFAGTNPPNGWLLCDGTAFNQADYPELYAAISNAFGESGATFNVPDTRGRFLRGLDGAAGRDPDSGSRTASNTGGNTGNAIGSVQDDQTGAHNHAFSGTTNNDGQHQHNYTDPVIGSLKGMSYDNSGSAVEYPQANGGITPPNQGVHTHNFSGTTNMNSGSESRPKNLNVQYIIKF